MKQTVVYRLSNLSQLKGYILLSVILLFGATLFQPGTTLAQAQTEEGSGIDLNIEAGLDGYYFFGEFLLIQVLASNSGPAVDGYLEVSWENGNDLYRVPLDLPTQSNKRLEFYVNPPGFVTNVTVTLYDREGTEVAQSISNLLATLDRPDSVLYGVVSPQPDRFDRLDRITLGRSDVGIAFLSLDTLPEDPLGWLDLDMLILNDVDTNQLSVKQRSALETWVEMGGQLVVTGGASWQKSTAALTELLPVTVSGSNSVADLPGFRDQAGIDFRDPGPYLIANSTLKDGELLYHESGEPILARRPYGQGNVFFLALDPQFAPMVDWDGSDLLYNTIGAYIAPPMMWEQAFLNEDSLSRALNTNPSLRLPSAWLILALLVGYIIVIGPVNYLFLKRSGRRELAWLTIPGISLLFSLLAFLVGLQFKGNQVILSQLSVVSGTAGGPALYNTGIGIYSPNRQHYDISLEAGTISRTLSRNNFGFNQNEELTFEYNGTTNVSNLLVDVGSTSSFGTRLIRETTPLEGEVELNADGSVGNLRITNVGNEPLININLLVGAATYSVENIDPGETVTKEVNIPSGSRNRFLTAAARDIDEFRATTTTTTGSSYVESPLQIHHNNFLGENGVPHTGYIYEDPVAYQKDALLGSLFQEYGDMQVFTPLTHITLVGWSESPPISAELNGERFDQEAVTIYFIEIPIK